MFTVYRFNCSAVDCVYMFLYMCIFMCTPIKTDFKIREHLSSMPERRGFGSVLHLTSVYGFNCYVVCAARIVCKCICSCVCI